MKYLLQAFAVLACLASSYALADARSLAMGGVVVPGPGAADTNPAYAAMEIEGPKTIALPLGLLPFLLKGELQPPNTAFDVLATVDQATHLDTFIFNLPRSPEEIIFDVSNEGLSIDFVGGSPIVLERGEPMRYSRPASLPVNFGVGPLRIGIRPYLTIDGSVQPLGGFSEALSGSNSFAGQLEGSAEAEAGITADVMFASKLPMPATEEFPAEVYVGVRGAGLLGLARVNGDITADVEAVLDSNGQPTGEVIYSYAGTAFYTDPSIGEFGFGAQADIGVAFSVPSPSGTLNAGFAIQNLGFVQWQGNEVIISGTEQGDTSSAPTPVTRRVLNSGLALGGSLSYAMTAEQLEAPVSVLVALDGGTQFGAVYAHVGSEVGVGPVLLRAGGGYDGGFNFGAGAGIDLGPLKLDFALDSHIAPFTTQRAYGLVGSVGFAF